MKITGRVEVEVVTEIVCDVCLLTTAVEGGGLQYGTLRALWGYGAKHDGERYELHLCESCFFQAVANLKQERRSLNLFTDNSCAIGENFGLVTKDDDFGEIRRR